MSKNKYVWRLSGLPLILYAQNQKIGKPKNVKSVEAINPKELNHDSKNQVTSHMPDDGES